MGYTKTISAKAAPAKQRRRHTRKSLRISESLSDDEVEFRGPPEYVKTCVSLAGWRRQCEVEADDLEHRNRYAETETEVAL